ncbi:AAA family ATPase [Streptomyces sp. NPDC004647]|uniref:helix-turn-helix transcriptional regulator n=1 Tax=Streptomyces sp. NPDC004647 TaxID=3154671 RepID=UPI0033A8D094
MLHGQAEEQTRLTQLLTSTRAGRGGALVLRGEMGIGRSALLDWLAESAPSLGVRVLRVTGFQAEEGLAHAGLIQLLCPIQERVSALPPPQAAAFHAALDGSASPHPDRSLTGLAVLTILADLARESPVVCLVDDAQWLDQATADALLFAARRVTDEPVAMVFTARDQGFTAAGLPERHLARLHRDDAAQLLAERGLGPAGRARVIEDAAGNPLALNAFVEATYADLIRRVPLPVADHILAPLRSQISVLPDRTKLMMVIAAAAGDQTSAVLDAARRLGVGLEDLAPAEQAGLLHVTGGQTVGFRHPLLAPAAYHGAVLARRVRVHQSLADASGDADRRVQHLAAAATTPDDNVAAMLVQAADRARRTSCFTKAATLLEQAAQLATKPRDQAHWLGEASRSALSAGNAACAAELIERAEHSNTESNNPSTFALLRATVDLEHGHPLHAARLLTDHATAAPPAQAATMLRTAATYAWLSGDPTLTVFAHKELQEMDQPDDIVQGLAYLAEDDYTRGLPSLAAFLAKTPSMRCAAEDTGELMRMLYSALILGDDDASRRLAEAEVMRRRQHGLIGGMPELLTALAHIHMLNGSHGDARAALSEAADLAPNAATPPYPVLLDLAHIRIPAIEGDQDQIRHLAHSPRYTAHAGYHSALGLLELAHGDYNAALRNFAATPPGPWRHTALLITSASDEVEAAIRLEQTSRAQESLTRFTTWAQAADRPWAHAVALRCRALVRAQSGENTLAEQDFVRSLDVHPIGIRPFERARTELLYGQWLRRARRRADAREILRSALDVFERLSAGPWVKRTLAELRAAGEPGTLHLSDSDLENRLTPQELTVVRLAAKGHTSRQIADKLYLSPRTVESHLSSAYPKLGVSSRRELAQLSSS